MAVPRVAAQRIFDKEQFLFLKFEDLMAMKVEDEELKEELEARGEGKSGNKAWLRRRLHAAIVSEYCI